MYTVQNYQLMGSSVLLMPVCARTRRLTLAKISDVITGKRRYCSVCVCVCEKSYPAERRTIKRKCVYIRNVCTIHTHYIQNEWKFTALGGHEIQSLIRTQ